MTTSNQTLLLSPTVGPLWPAYAMFAERAAFCEKQHEWSEALRFWKMASARAQHRENSEWAQSRAEYCQRRLDTGG